MILAEPPPTQGDLHFRLFGFPVRVHPFFWLVCLIMGLRGNSTPPAEVLAWLVAVFVSIVIHELGHAFLQRRYGGNPRIVLHGFGGLAICGDCDRSPRSQILISLAGPMAGFLFAVVLVLVLAVSGHQPGIYTEGSLTSQYSEPDGLRLFGLWVLWEQFDSEHVNFLLRQLFFINILWGLINLLPIYPLDGGQISREVCQLSDPRQGLILSLRISMVAAIAMAIVGLSWGLFTVIMFGYLAYSSYKTLEAYRASLW